MGRVRERLELLEGRLALTREPTVFVRGNVLVDSRARQRPAQNARGDIHTGNHEGIQSVGTWLQAYVRAMAPGVLLGSLRVADEAHGSAQFRELVTRIEYGGRAGP